MELAQTSLGAADVLAVVSWLLLIVVGGLLSAVLFKLVFLLHSVSEFMTIARYELSPVIKELRLTADHLEVISGKAASGVESVEKGIHALRHTPDLIKSGTGAVVEGIRQSFAKR